MVGTKRFGRNTVAWTIAPLIAILMVTVIACGGEADEVVAIQTNAADVQPSSTPEPDAFDDIASSGIQKRTFTGPVVVPLTEPEPGSDEEAIIETMERFVQAVITSNVDAYLAECNPTRTVFTVPQAEFFFEDVFSQFGDPAGWNYRDVTVRLYGEDTAISETTIYHFDEVYGEDYSISWSKVDGIWYSNSNCNTRS